MFSNLMKSFNSMPNLSIQDLGIGYTPDLIDLTAGMLAYQRYQETGAFLISDHLLEQRLASSLLQRNDLLDVSVYGFENKIRLTIVGIVKHVKMDIVLDIQPISVIWGTYHKMNFDVDIISIEARNKMVNVATMGLKKLMSNFLPLGGIVTDISSWAVRKIFKNAGLLKFKELTSLTERGVTWNNNRVTVDLKQQPELAPLYNTIHIPNRDLMNIFAPSMKLIDQIELTGISADRAGLVFQAKLSPIADTIFKGTAILGKEVQKMIAIK